VLIISSPDKAQYSDKHGTKNEYHVRELYQDEFDDLLARYFSSHLILGQRIAYGSLLVGPQQQQTEFISYQHGSQTELRASGLPEPIYLIAFASDEALPPVPNSAYITDSPGNQPEMEYLRSRLESRAALIRDLGSRMTGVATALSENKSEICGLDTHLHDLSDDPASEGILSKGLTDLARQITTLCERNAELLARIEALEQTQEAAQRERELEQRKRDLEQQEHEERREIERQRVERIAAESAARQAADHAQIEHLSQRLHATYRSASWRVTSPMRVTANLVRSVVRNGRGLISSRPSSAHQVEPVSPSPVMVRPSSVLDRARWISSSNSTIDSRPRILILPAVFAVGGVERLIAAIMRQLSSRFRFVIVSNEPHTTQSGCLFDQVTQYCEAQFDLATMGSRTEHISLLGEIFDAFQPELVWVCNGSVWFHQNVDSLMSLFEGVPVVDQQVYDSDAGWINSLTPAYVNRVTRVVAINAKILSRFLEMDIPREKIDLIYSAVDLDGLRLDARDAQLESTPLVKAARRTYAFVARFSEQKRPMDFVESAILIAQREPTIQFLMVGDGPLASSCQAKIKKSEVSNITVSPFTNDLPSDVYARVDGVVFVSAYEGLPLVMLEALASGVPVLATDVGDIRLVAEDLGGGCVVMENAIGNPSRIADAILSFDSEIVKHQTDARRLKATVRSRFGSETVATSYFECWAKAWQSFADRDLVK
ncbi:MAG: glycosyltransferase family 4 protein, partial [Burkholderiaceae bacterium]